MRGVVKSTWHRIGLLAGSMSHEQYHRALGYSLILYLTLIIAVITLIPFPFAAPTTLRFIWRGNLHDVVSNIVLFIPLGFFFQITHTKAGWRSFFGALGLGLVVSSLVESGQLFLPQRYSSIIDIVTNTMGAGVGAATANCQKLLARKGPMPENSRFGVPLLSSVYLLIPLLWVGGSQRVENYGGWY